MLNRGLSLPLRDCTRSYNSLMPEVAKVSAVDVTAKEIFERLYLVPGLEIFLAFFTISVYPHSRRSLRNFFSNFLPSDFGPNFFCHHDPTSNLAESRCVLKLMLRPSASACAVQGAILLLKATSQRDLGESCTEKIEGPSGEKNFSEIEK